MIKVIAFVAVLACGYLLYKIFNKRKFIKDTTALMLDVESRLGSFIKHKDKEILTGKSQLYFTIAIRRNYSFDEAAKFISYAEKLSGLIHKNNLEVLEKLTADYVEMFTEMVGNGKRYIISCEIEMYAEQFKEEAQEYMSKCYYYSSEVIKRFMEIYNDPQQYLQNLNAEYIKNEKIECKMLFDNIGGKSLDEHQRNAVVNDDHRQLVIAGAGTGKTLTVSAKVKYLVERKGINPRDILLISFTRKAADEMSERILKLGIDIDSFTFHRFGLNIIRNVNKKVPDIADNIDEYINRYLLEKVYSDSILAKKFLFLLGVLMLPVFEDYQQIGERIEEEQRHELITLKGMYHSYKNKKKKDVLDKQIEYLNQKMETLNSRIQSLKNSDNEEGTLIERDITNLKNEIQILSLQKISIKNERLKSAEEVMLANMFFLDGVEYQYEVEYPFDDPHNFHKKYRPDFYISKHDVYWEHFGVDKDMRARQYSSVEEAKYIDSIKWKRKTHEINNTKLAETYSWQFAKNRIEAAVEKNYRDFGIEKHEVNYCDVIEQILKSEEKSNIDSFKTLLSTFISLFKSSGYTLQKFDELRKDIENYKDDNLSIEALDRRKTRDMLFLEIAESFFVYYNEALLADQKIDFNDMIIQATEYINHGLYVPNYKYIIVDEYQDISIGRYNLIQAILEKSDAKFFCVGDDWQSIYRFSGSEVDLLVNFEKYFGKYSRIDLVNTYRNSQQLLDVSGAFIMMNQYQTPKQLKSKKSIKKPIQIYYYHSEAEKIIGDHISNASNCDITDVFLESVSKIAKEFPQGNILVLGRNNSDIGFLLKNKKIEIKQDEGETRIVCVGYENVKINYLTVHRSKGLEADNVIILNLRNATNGFPNQVADDPVLNLLRKTAETYPFAEERRLFYVALTRTKNFTLLLAPIIQSSRFLHDIKNNHSVNVIMDMYKKDDSAEEHYTNEGVSTSLTCPVCKVGVLIKRTAPDGKQFAACSNYPSCTYTSAYIEDVRKNNRCPICDNFLVKRKGKHGEFLGCMSYPYCTYTENI